MRQNQQLNWKNWRFAGVVAGALALGSWTVQAQNSTQNKTAPAKKSNTPPAARTGDINIRNHPTLGRASSDLANGIQRLTKDVRVTQDGEDFILYADDLTYYENDNVAVARQKLLVESRDSDLTGEVIRADFNEKIITVTGKVVMKSHGRDDGIQPAGGRNIRNEVLHKPSRIVCDRLDYDYENREAKLSGNIRMVQGENTGTCEQIVFDEENNIARLMGKVEFTNGDGQTIRTGDLTIWIDDNKIATERRVNIKIPRRNDPKQTAATTKAPRSKVNLGSAPKLPADILNDPARKAVPTPLPPREPDAEEESPPTRPAPEDETAPGETAPVKEEKSSSEAAPTKVSNEKN